jgi:plastocyanin
VTASRRHILQIGAGFLAGLSLPCTAFTDRAVEIRMVGKADGSHVWFDPVGLRIQPGQTIRFINQDPGNSHTTTAYHPQNFGRPLRIPEGAAPWNSDYLLPDGVFSVSLTLEGIYDFFCIPHEHAGMVGRIIVGGADRPPMATTAQTGDREQIPEAAKLALPSIEEIMRQGVVRRS